MGEEPNLTMAKKPVRPLINQHSLLLVLFPFIFFLVTGTKSSIQEETVPDSNPQPAEKMEKTPVSREARAGASETTEDRAAEVVAPSKAVKRGPETETVRDDASGGKKARDDTTAGTGIRCDVTS